MASVVEQVSAHTRVPTDVTTPSAPTPSSRAATFLAISTILPVHLDSQHNPCQCDGHATLGYAILGTNLNACSRKRSVSQLKTGRI